MFFLTAPNGNFAWQLRYAEAVLQELQKIDKEKALRKKVEGMGRKSLTA